MGKNKFETIDVFVPKENQGESKAQNFDNLSLSQQEILRFGQDTKHRKILVYWMMGVVSVWLIAVLLFAVFNKVWGLAISENVLITLLATTTLNVLGLSKIILSGLFRNTSWKRKNNTNPKQ